MDNLCNCLLAVPLFLFLIILYFATIDLKASTINATPGQVSWCDNNYTLSSSVNSLHWYVVDSFKIDLSAMCCSRFEFIFCNLFQSITDRVAKRQETVVKKFLVRSRYWPMRRSRMLVAYCIHTVLPCSLFRARRYLVSKILGLVHGKRHLIPFLHDSQEITAARVDWLTVHDHLGMSSWEIHQNDFVPSWTVILREKCTWKGPTGTRNFFRSSFLRVIAVASIYVSQCPDVILKSWTIFGICARTKVVWTFYRDVGLRSWKINVGAISKVSA